MKRFLKNPVHHSVDSGTSPVPAMTHHVFEVHSVDAKRDLVHRLASGTGRRILFMRTKHQARKLARQLTEAGIPSVDLHGNLSQNARDRNLAAFSSGDARVLVATDVAARGVHVDDVELVVHVDPPAEHKAYLHRSGRTARAGAAGDVVTVVLPEQRRDLAALMRKASISVTPQRVTGDAPARRRTGRRRRPVRRARTGADSPPAGAGTQQGPAPAHPASSPSAALPAAAERRPQSAGGYATRSGRLRRSLLGPAAAASSEFQSRFEAKPHLTGLFGQGP